MNATLDVENYLLNAANSAEAIITTTMINLYSKDVDLESLEKQAALLPAAIKLTVNVKKVTSIRTICEAFNNSPSYKKLLDQVDALLHLYLTIPVTTATNERVFSTLRRVKTYLRSTMTQKTLNNSLLLHSHKTKTDELDLKNVAEVFRRSNDTRMNFFSSFI